MDPEDVLFVAGMGRKPNGWWMKASFIWTFRRVDG
jgi:hypothetical protein